MSKDTRMRAWGWGVVLSCVATGAFAQKIDLDLSIYGFSLEFEQAIQAIDNARAERLVRLAPAMPMVCEWESDTSLYCGFDEEAPLATRYRVDLAAGLRTVDGKAIGARTLRGETARPWLRPISTEWKEGRPVIRLASDHKLSTEAITAALRLEIDGKPATVALKKTPSNDFDLVLPPVAPNALVKVSVVPGLRSQDGPLTGEQDEPLALLRVDEPFAVRNAVCAGMQSPLAAPAAEGRIALDGCVPGEPIRVQFSRALDAASRTAWIAQWPAGMRLLSSGTEHEWTTRGDASKGVPGRAPGAWVEFTVDAANATQAFDIAGLVAEGGAALAMPVSARISTVAHRPAFSAPKSLALLQDPRAPVAIARNTPASTFQVRSVDARDATETIAVPAAGEAPVAIASDAARKALANGGLVELAVAGEKDTDARMTVAAPDFDVYAVIDQGSVLVWANEWSGHAGATGAAIAGADAELLQRGADGALQVIATARTDNDGTALLRVPREFRSRRTNAGPTWFVRVQNGKRSGAARAVLPLALPEYGGLLTSGEPTARSWGVVDRPLYRAGETVQWRLWQREFANGDFRAPPAGQSVPMQLYDNLQYRQVLAWTATTDGSGALAGATRLPSQLPDGDYCIEPAAKDGQGVCFFVGTFRAQDLWLQASTPDRVLRDGDTLAFDVEAGYYSGGVASGSSFEHVRGVLQPASIGDVYDAFSAYAFDVDDHREWRLEGTESLRLVADEAGRAHASLPVAFVPLGDRVDALPAFGRISLTVEAKLSDRESATSRPAKALYARHARYVGLKLVPDWIDAGSPVKVEGVVVTAEGKPVPDARIDVDVFFGDDDKAAPLRSCTIAAGQPTDCTFPRKQSGVYRIVARSGDAAPVTLHRDVWTGWASAGESVSPKLELAAPAGARGTPLRIAVEQAEQGAQVLLVARWGALLLDRKVATVDAANPVIELPTTKAWPRNIIVTAYIRGGAKEGALPAGFRAPVPVRWAQEKVSFAEDAPGEAPVGVAFDRPRAAPGDKARLRLRNTSPGTRSITLAVIDDALYALGATYMEDMDPAHAWADAQPGWFAPETRGFDRWNDHAWQWNIAPRRGGVNPIDIRSVESTTILTAEQVAGIPVPRNVTTVALLAPGTVAREEDSAGELYSVEVVGAAAIVPNPQDKLVPPPPSEPPVVLDAPSPVDVQAPRPEAKAPVAPPRGDIRAALAEALASARVRSQFADTAVWRTDIELAPGESREVELTVPDNLTRWRAIAWSNDTGGDFAKAEATLEAGLPVEARLQAPVRVYPGDRTRVAANVRHTAEQATQAAATLRVQDGRDARTHEAVLALDPRGQASFGVSLAPTRPGALLLTAAAATDAGRDAIAATVEVASPTIPAQKSQAGWIGTSPLSLTLPALPEGARDARLEVSVWRGNTALLQTWTKDLRDYPHRCWEQMLSRAIGAALALERNDPAWTDAKAVVQEALDNAAVFQQGDGGMQFFAQPPAFERDSESNIALSAYTADAFDLLRTLGYQVPEEVDASVRQFLSSAAKRSGDVDGDDDTNRAIAAASGAPIASTDALWSRQGKLPLPGRIALARALARQGSPNAAESFAALLDAAPKHGGARRVTDTDRAWTRWLGSDLREQCSLIRLYDDFPQFAPKGAALELQAGLSDLYAGGATWADTQSSAICLIALRDAGGKQSAPIAVDARLGARSQRITLGAGEQRAAVGFDAPQGTLALQAIERGEAPVAYLAHLDYLEDARRAQSTAIGFALDRHYAVLRNHQWVPIATAGPLRDGDWVRISLVVTTGKERHFVAITDDLPGGLRPMELSLAGVAGVDVQASGDLGDWAFDQRRLDPRKPKFYAEHLWPGRHEIHYFA
ncbi:MAG TPA: alpha-2-macroglobulin family protein, partial [Lysobacter sp.]|nr:alpha-2-macroglobulin family protein [Lysobacter sp.]